MKDNIETFITLADRYNDVMSNTTWLTDKDGFVEAIRTDTYAEYELPNGSVLITDTEFDGTFNPYVIPQTDSITSMKRNRDKIAADIEKAFGCFVKHMEIDDHSDLPCYYPIIDKEDMY